jgi:chromatin remodeling complex protein RSC6
MGKKEKQTASTNSVKKTTEAVSAPKLKAAKTTKAKVAKAKVVKTKDVGNKVTENKVTENKVTGNKVTENKVTKNKVLKVETDLPHTETCASETQVNEVQSHDTPQSAVEGIFESLIAQHENCLNIQRHMIQLLKKTAKAYTRDRKDYEKNAARAQRRAKRDPNRKKRDPSGFAVATEISDDLCEFLKLEKGSKISRTDVTRKVTTYIREKNLQIPENRRSFKPDTALETILGPLQDIDKDKGFTYFNLQRYITPHITSSASSASSASSSSSSH